MKNTPALVMNAALTAIIGKAGIAVHIVIGAMATQSRLVIFATLWTFERTVKNEKSIYLPALQKGRRLAGSNSDTWTLFSVLRRKRRFF